jgi:hypothetical protein
MSITLDLLTFISEIPTPVSVALSGVASGLGTWIISIRKISASIERARLKMVADASTGENTERAAFRAALMAEVSALRQLVKECENEKVSIRERVNRAEEQILVLNASNEIMEKWVTFFKDRQESDDRMSKQKP